MVSKRSKRKCVRAQLFISAPPATESFFRYRSRRPMENSPRFGGTAEWLSALAFASPFLDQSPKHCQNDGSDKESAYAIGDHASDDTHQDDRHRCRQTARHDDRPQNV